MESKGTTRAITALFALFFIQTFVLIAFMLNQEPSRTTTIHQVGKQGVQGRIGDAGLAGKDGISVVGAQGVSGLPGVSTTSYQMLQPVVVQGTPGEKGADGQPGKNGEPGVKGESPEVRVVDCQLQTKYLDDDTWSTRGNVCEAQQ